MKVLIPSAAALLHRAQRTSKRPARRSPSCSPTSTGAIPGIRFRMIDEQDRIRPHMRIFVNGEQVFDLAQRAAPDRRGGHRAGAERRLRIWIALALLGAAPLPALGQPKVVELYIGYSPGGGYDVYARLLARHIGRHIPGNPTVVPKSMPGAGSLTLANWLYKAAPRDGSVFGTIGRAIAFDPLLGEGAQFKRDRVRLGRQRQRRGERVRGVGQERDHALRRPLYARPCSSAAPAPPRTPTSSRAR